MEVSQQHSTRRHTHVPSHARASTHTHNARTQVHAHTHAQAHKYMHISSRARAHTRNTRTQIHACTHWKLLFQYHFGFTSVLTYLNHLTSSKVLKLEIRIAKSLVFPSEKICSVPLFALPLFELSTDFNHR